MTNEKQPTVIKKYANRRLYHTGTSSYVTLEDLALMVKQGEDFTVSDAKTGEEITRSVLAQIIFEQEGKSGQNLLPITFLRQLIRFYGDSIQSLVPSYLEFSIASLTNNQQKLREQMAKSMGTTFGPAAIDAIQEQTRANLALFQNTLRMFTPFAYGEGARSDNTKPEGQRGDPAKVPGARTPSAGLNGTKPATSEDEVAALKRELDEMRSRLDRLDNR
jgi:polyhydroxyalkanoate synthesis repressor PhaR